MSFCLQIKAFLHQRFIELTNGETLSLQHQVQAVAPFVLQQYTSDVIHTMLSDISTAISLLTNRKTRDLIMILNSKRCYRVCYFPPLFVSDILIYGLQLPKSQNNRIELFDPQ